MPAKSNSFPKQLKLKSHLAVAAVFEKGTRCTGFPLVGFIHWVPFDGQPLRVAVAVPKRRVRSAVDRNLQKRRLREIFRLNQQLFLPQPDHTAHIVLMLAGDKKTPYSEIEKGFFKVVKKMAALKSE
jgi:ribonuclease P protein component